jgi:uncharacterized glyoxalase superfamily protein PhnB
MVMIPDKRCAAMNDPTARRACPARLQGAILQSREAKEMAFTTVCPSLRYSDGPAMYDWLVQAFGFTPVSKHLSQDGRTLLHGELGIGDSIIMLGSATDNPFGGLVDLPARLGGTTISPYVVTDDVDGLCERARAAGAVICMEPTQQPYGARDFICRDPEGHLWCFGTYRPGAP